MNYFKIAVVFIALISGINKICSQNEVRTLERTTSYILGHNIYLELDYVDVVNVRYWKKDSIKLVASVDLTGEKGLTKNDDFELQITNANGKHNLLGKVLNQTAHYVYKKDASDYKPQGAYKEKVLIVGTQIELFIPMNANLETKVVGMGDIEIDHNGANLLASTIGNITLKIDKAVNADINIHSQFGGVEMDERLNIIESQLDEIYKLNKGGDILISFSAFGTITILPKN
ncbi:hypothetical protein [Winogradskyella sp.]|uniref:hypothetical protein n=1 Tax=Winogradskyella sp. TaxID=1883156 RepID=UPI00262FE87D|nr:hypothetical protein [Winogradskyella sp.]